MKRLALLTFSTLCLFFTFSIVAFAAESAIAVIAAPVPAPTLFSWFNANSVPILALALVISELLATIPGFQGNGILDTIIKALRALTQKNQ